jgi:hypothetical protein
MAKSCTEDHWQKVGIRNNLTKLSDIGRKDMYPMEGIKAQGPNFMRAGSVCRSLR